jgi:hypothetical protein
MPAGLTRETLLHDLAVGHANRDELEVAEQMLRSALATRPDYADAHKSLGLLLLKKGELREGFEHYRWRWQTGWFEQSLPRLSRPAWDGRPVPGLRLLVLAEQGLGDVIMGIRFAEHLAALGLEVLVAAPEELHPLLRRAPGVRAVIGPGPLPAYDAYAGLFDLPALLGLDLPDLVRSLPYLVPDPDAVAVWRRHFEVLAPAARRRVGLVWHGNPAHPNDAARSIPAAALAPVLAVPGVALFSLHKELREDDRALLAPAGPVHDLSARLGCLTDTAAALAALDLLISVDTAVVHLAGALARPAWLLLPAVADWRWQRHRSDSPWYPSLRLFRQPAAASWDGLLPRIAGELRTA